MIKYINYQSQPVDSNATPFTNKTPVFDANELAELSTIANSCFDKYGSVITQARVLMNTVSTALIEFQDNCKPEFNHRKANKQNQMFATAKIETNLYPNPNNGTMLFEYDLGVDTSAKMRIFDINGKLISSYSLNQSMGKLNINNEALTSGVYYYSIFINEKSYSTNKIIIIK